MKTTMDLWAFLEVKMFSPNSWNEVLRVYKPWDQIQYHSYNECSINVEKIVSKKTLQISQDQNEKIALNQ